MENYFEKKGYPSINIYDNYFEIKAKDYWEFRQFNFKDIASIEYYNSNHKWYNFIFTLDLLSSYFAYDDDHTLKINLKNKGFWKYNYSYKKDPEFVSLIKHLIELTS